MAAPRAHRGRMVRLRPGGRGRAGRSDRSRRGYPTEGEQVMPNLVAPSGRNEFTVTLDLRNATLVAVLLGNVGAPNAYTCQRSEERRVGKECRCRGSAGH